MDENRRAALQNIVGKDLAPSDWITLDQELITAFGDLTFDPDPYHQDEQWASEHSPFKSTIAYGFLTLSLLSKLQRSAFENTLQNDDASELTDIGMPLNYGFDKLRFVQPIRTGEKVRGKLTITSCEPKDGKGYLLKVNTIIEIAGVDRPALIADWLFLLP